jgi:aspartyl-tRNA(Asn)/glutamyl-tRNA(Gln) amidotransferase subunit A
VAEPDPFMTIHALVGAMDGGELSAAEVMAVSLARIEAHEGKLAAFVARYDDEARALAAAADAVRDAGGPVGPLHGVPMAMKDIVHMAGRITTGGRPTCRERVSTETAPIVERLTAAGAIIVGKTHSVEMAMGGWGTNEHMGTPWNPWDPSTHRTPGGSSSGSGVAVAAGYVPGAIGTDTGGSVRLPAAWCGLAGLKVTEGVLPTDGIDPLSSTLDTPGPMTRSVIDAALMFDVLLGREGAVVRRDFAAGAGLYARIRRPIAGLRLAVMPEAERAVVDAEILAIFDRSIECLAGLGAEIVTIDLPKPFDAYREAAMVIMAAEGYHFNKMTLDDDSLPMDRWVRRRLLPGGDINADRYLSALERRRLDSQAFLDALAGVHALLTPTTMTAAVPVSEVDESQTPGHFTRAANYLGLCALAVPNGFTDSGLPSSLQVICRPRREVTALRIGYAYEQANDWKDRRSMA